MSLFRKGLVGYLGAQIVQGLTGFASLYVFTRWLTPQGYGQYALAFATATLAHTLCFSWSEAAMARFWNQASDDGHEARSRLIATLVRASLGLCILYAVVLGLGLSLWPEHGNYPLVLGCALVSPLFRTLLKLFQEQKRAAGQVGMAAGTEIILQISSLALSLVFIRLGLGAMAPFLAASLCSLCLLGLLARPLFIEALKTRLDRQILNQALAYGLPIGLSLLLTTVLFTTDRFVIAALLGEAKVGAYHAAVSLASRSIDVLFIALGTASAPALIRALEHQSGEGFEAEARGQFEVMLGLCLPAALGLILTAQPLCELMVGEALRSETAQLVPVIVLGALAAGLSGYYFNQAFILTKKTAWLSLAMGLPLGLNLIASLILTPKFGALGAAYAASGSLWFGLGLSLILTRRVLVMPIPFKPLVMILGLTALMTLCVQFVPASGGLTELILKAVIGILVYGLGALILDIAHLRQLLLQKLGLSSEVSR